MDIYVFGFAAGVAAVVMEWRYATHDSFFSWQVLPWAMVTSPIIMYSVFRMVKASPNLILALVIFSFSTLVFRLLVTWKMGQPITPGTWIALGLLLASQIARKF